MSCSTGPRAAGGRGNGCRLLRADGTPPGAGRLRAGRSFMPLSTCPGSAARMISSDFFSMFRFRFAQPRAEDALDRFDAETRHVVEVLAEAGVDERPFERRAFGAEQVVAEHRAAEHGNRVARFRRKSRAGARWRCRRRLSAPALQRRGCAARSRAAGGRCPRPAGPRRNRRDSFSLRNRSDFSDGILP